MPEILYERVLDARYSCYFLFALPQAKNFCTLSGPIRLDTL
jgi:hypothetical protein